MIRRSFAVVAVAATFLTACGSSPPGANELAIEVIDSMVADGTISDAKAACMRDKVGAYEGEQLDDIADRASSKNADAIKQLQQFQDDLAACPG